MLWTETVTTVEALGASVPVTGVAASHGLSPRILNVRGRSPTFRMVSVFVSAKSVKSSAVWSVASTGAIAPGVIDVGGTSAAACVAQCPRRSQVRFPAQSRSATQSWAQAPRLQWSPIGQSRSSPQAW
jgi:hypothetical protein